MTELETAQAKAHNSSINNSLYIPQGGITGVTTTTGYMQVLPSQKPFIQLNFDYKGSIQDGKAALRFLIRQLEAEIDASFDEKGSLEFHQYSRSFTAPDRNESYSFGA